MPRPEKKRKRRARGSGSIFHDPRRGVWVGRVPLGRKPNGRTHYREVSHKDQRRCVELMRELQAPADSVTVAEFAVRWLQTLRVRAQTADSYANSVTRRINPVLGHLRLAAVTSLQVELAAREWEAQYKTATVLVTLSHLRILFRAAIRAGVIQTSPVAAAAKPRAHRVTLQTYSPDELARIIETALLRPSGGIIACLAATGMRKGEAIALDVPDFDRVAGTVAITKTVTARHGIGPPKSVHSTRTIRVPAAALPAFTAAAGVRKAGPLFRGVDGGRWSVGAVDWEYEKIVRRLGLARKKPHALRHSLISALIAAGIGIGDVGAYAGITAAMIVRVYLHPSAADPSQTLDRLFSTRPSSSAPRRASATS